jgi:hypothetical protein
MFEKRKIIFRSYSRKWSWRDSGKYRTGISGTFPGEEQTPLVHFQVRTGISGTFPGEYRNLRDIIR